MTLSNTRYKVKVDGSFTESFEVKKGLRQGDTVLFNFILESIIRDSHIQTLRTIYTRSHQCLAYADDVVIITHTQKELAEQNYMEIGDL